MILPIQLSKLLNPYQGLLLDACGIFWGGNEIGLLPGSKEVMEKGVAGGKIIGVLSNSTQRADQEINKFARHGLIQGQHFHFLITSGEMARAMVLNKHLPFETPRHSFWVLGDVHPRFSSHKGIFQDSVYRETSDLNEADFIYLAIPHIQGEDQADPERFRDTVRAIIDKKLPMVCPNPDQYAPDGNPPRAVVRQGSLAKLYEDMDGQVFYIGKPHRSAYIAAMELFRLQGVESIQNILMIGDTPETDIRGAKQFGMPAALVLQTGIMAERIAREGLEKAVGDLPLQDTPNYFIQRFADDF